MNRRRQAFGGCRDRQPAAGTPRPGRAHGDGRPAGRRRGRTSASSSLRRALRPADLPRRYTRHDRAHDVAQGQVTAPVARSSPVRGRPRRARAREKDADLSLPVHGGQARRRGDRFTQRPVQEQRVDGPARPRRTGRPRAGRKRGAATREHVAELSPPHPPIRPSRRRKTRKRVFRGEPVMAGLKKVGRRWRSSGAFHHATTGSGQLTASGGAGELLCGGRQSSAWAGRGRGGAGDSMAVKAVCAGLGPNGPNRRRINGLVSAFRLCRYKRFDHRRKNTGDDQS